MRNKVKSLLPSPSTAEQHITALKIAYELHDKEQNIYKKTIEFIDENKYEYSLDYLFYDFQILTEFIGRFYNELNIQIKQEEFDATSQLLWLANRFLQIGHYDAAWSYLRKAFESWVSCLHGWTATTNTKDKIMWLVKQRKYDSGILFLDGDEVYKIYQYLSNKYTHRTTITSDIAFKKDTYIELSWTMTVLIIIMSYLVVDMIDGDELVKYRQKDIQNPIDDYKFYAAYIWPLVGSAIVSSSKSWFLNGLNASKIQEYEFKNEVWLDLSKWIREKPIR